MKINFNNFERMVSLMDEHEKYPEYMWGENEKGEVTWASINEDSITMYTAQHNNRTRVNVCWRNGTKEEYFIE